MKHVLLATLLLLLPTLTLAADPAKHVKADEAAKIIADGKVAVIDVRTPDEFKDGHIKGAKNIDIMSKEFETQLGKLDKTQPTLVHLPGWRPQHPRSPNFRKTRLHQSHPSG